MGILDSLLPHQIVVQNLKKFHVHRFLAKSNIQFKQKYYKKSTIYIPPSFHDICLNLYDKQT